MRIPLKHIYRAFPELDRFSDDECERLMQRVKLDTAGGMSAEAAGIATCLVLFGFSCVGFTMLGPLVGDIESSRYGVVVVVFSWGLVAGVPPIGGLLARDAVLRRQLRAAINRHLEKIKCLDCSYLLIGQIASEGRVTCPECGRRHTLSELAIDEADLIPPTQPAHDTVGQ